MGIILIHADNGLRWDVLYKADICGQLEVGVAV